MIDVYKLEWARDSSYGWIILLENMIYDGSIDAIVKLSSLRGSRQAE